MSRVLCHVGFGKITLRSSLMSGSKPVQPLDPEARHSQCSVFAGSSAAAVLSQFERGTGLSWAVSRLMLNPQSCQAGSASGLRPYVLYLLLGFKKNPKVLLTAASKEERLDSLGIS